VLLDYLGGVVLGEAEVPSTFRLRPVVDDHVRAVLAQAEAVDGIDPHLAQDALRADPIFESSPRVLNATLFTVAARTDEAVRLVISDLRRGLCFLRYDAPGCGPNFLLELLLFLRDDLLRLPGSANRVKFSLNENHSRKPVYHVRGTDCMIRCRRDYMRSKVARRREDRLNMGRSGIRREYV